MDRCSHSKLLLLPSEQKRLRCRRCHLTIKPDDLDTGYCPECFETDGTKTDDFETVAAEGSGPTRYRCESCGAIIETEQQGQ
jgi:hypothetical protein